MHHLLIAGAANRVFKFRFLIVEQVGGCTGQHQGSAGGRGAMLQVCGYLITARNLTFL